MIADRVSSVRASVPGQADPGGRQRGVKGDDGTPSAWRSTKAAKLGMVRQPAVPGIPQPSDRGFQVFLPQQPGQGNFRGIAFHGRHSCCNSAISQGRRFNRSPILWPRDGLSGGGSMGCISGVLDAAVHTSTARNFSRGELSFVAGGAVCGPSDWLRRPPARPSS
jgi:hypothetical protein